MTSAPGEKIDRYEQLLAKYDWHATHPPRGYQYGVGRGARPFSTTAELSVGVNVGADTREESDFFNALDRLETKPKPKRHLARDEAARSTSGDADEDSHAPAKLSLDDLVGLEGLSSTVVAPGGLVARSARTEEGELAEQHLFSDETSVITTNDILRGKLSTKEAALTSLLEMGSPEEQSTWITRARALRELGLARKAQETLIEGCALTGKKGTLIWEERLRYVSATDNPIARRRLLEDATAACPHAESLWLARIDLLAPAQRLDCVQQAVLACPTSEALWLLVVDVAPSVADERKLIQRALQQFPNLPRLWGRLARLVPYEAGKDIFRQVAQQHPSLELAAEAAKFVEDHFAHTGITAQTTPAPVPLVGRADAVFARLQTPAGFLEMSRQVHAAQRRYLDVAKEWSRRNWLAVATEAVAAAQRIFTAPVDPIGTADPDDTHTPAASPAVAQSVSTSSVHLWTAAFFILYCARPSMPEPLLIEDEHDASTGPRAAPHHLNASPTSSSRSFSHTGLSSTWVEDIVSFLPDAMDEAPVLCALCGAFALSLLPHTTRATTPDGWNVLYAAGTARDTKAHFGRVFSLVRRAIEVVPETEILHIAEGLVASGRGSPAEKEEEEEELSMPAVSSSAAPTVSRQSPLLMLLTALMSILFRRFAIEHAPSTHSSLFSTSHASPDVVATDAEEVRLAALARGVAVTEAAVVQSRFALVVASALRGRAQHRAALTILQEAEACLSVCLDQDTTHVMLRLSDRARIEDGRVHLLVACAACHAHLGMLAESEKYLLRGTTQCPNATSDVAWVGLVLHRRGRADQDETSLTKGILPTPNSPGKPIDPRTNATTAMLQATLDQALYAFPHSTTLWRMQLELAADTVTRAKAGAVQAHMAPEEQLQLEMRLAKDLRQLCQRALSAAHCRTSASLWAYVAVTIESTLLHAGPNARALLAEAMTVCCPPRHASSSSSFSSLVDKRMHHARALLGWALARVELQQGARDAAHEVVADTLRLLPKSKEGSFLFPVGELHQLYIDLEVPSQRGRAAMQVMQRWKSREPLALVSVATFYHSAKHYDRALTEALKAVKASHVVVTGATAIDGVHDGDDEDQDEAESRRTRHAAQLVGEDARMTLPLSVSGYYHVHSHEQSDIVYGDALALLWKLAFLPEYAKLIAARIGAFSEEEIEALTTLPEDVVRDWVVSVIADALSEARLRGDSTPSTSVPPAASPLHETQPPSRIALVPNAGPVWISVTEEAALTCVTLTGYREDTESLIRTAAARLAL